jgi:hypothetical protein
MKFFPQISASVSLSLVGMMSSSMPVLAQSVASLTAVVTDSSKAVLPAAQLQLIQEETHRTYKAASNRSGLASFPALMPGEYQLSVRMAGFAQSVTNVSLVTGDVKEVQVVLAPAGTKTEVIVNGNESGVESTDAAVQTVISQEHRAFPVPTGPDYSASTVSATIRITSQSTA